MNEIDLRRFDLNLMVVFEVLMTERNVTRAAERLGRMQPTAFAIDLMEQARPMLRGIERVLSPRHAFDPASSQRVFRLAAPDFVSTLFTSLLARLRSDAP